jgi:hypothetical protein
MAAPNLILRAACFSSTVEVRPSTDPGCMAISPF